MEKPNDKSKETAIKAMELLFPMVNSIRITPLNIRTDDEVFLISILKWLETANDNMDILMCVNEHETDSFLAIQKDVFFSSSYFDINGDLYITPTANIEKENCQKYGSYFPDIIVYPNNNNKCVCQDRKGSFQS